MFDNPGGFCKGTYDWPGCSGGQREILKVHVTPHVPHFSSHTSTLTNLTRLKVMPEVGSELKLSSGSTLLRLKSPTCAEEKAIMYTCQKYVK